MLDMQSALEVAEKIDDRMNLLEHVHSVGEEGVAAGDVSSNEALKAGTYIGLEGMPGGESSVTFTEGTTRVTEHNVFDMGSTEGALAVGFYQQITDTLSQGLTSAIDQAKKISTQMARSLNQ